MVELLAPVGSREALVAAVESGADAVYMGGKAFGARHYAPNFTDEELADAVRFAHLRGVLVYITVNTLVDDSEILALTKYLKYLYEIGVDAIIVQDLAVAVIARKIVPQLCLHASTQMTVHNLVGVQFLEELGFSRIVLAREVSLDDIALICKGSASQIEVFIHGALCISYSGQCLMSSMIGGRSGNRGRCAQPCRLPYTLVDRHGNDVLANADAGEYLLSPRDLNTIELIPELITRGVVSFKIEGRMKRPEYVAVVVDTYRRAIDSYLANNGKNTIATDTKKELAQVFNRDFTSAYLLGKQGRHMMSDRRPNNRGVHIGRVVSYDHGAKMAVIKIDKKLVVGDMVDFWIKGGDRVSSTVTSMTIKGQGVTEAHAGTEVTVPVHGSDVRTNVHVFKTFDAKLMERARSFFQIASPLRRISVDVIVTVALGKPLIVKMIDCDGYIGEGKTSFIAEIAQKRPLTEETIRKQIDRLGTTVFALDSLECRIDGQVMVPISEINEARRSAVEELEKSRLLPFKREKLESAHYDLPSIHHHAISRLQLSVAVDSIRGVQAVVEHGADWVVFGGESYHHQSFTAEDYRQAAAICRKEKKKILFATPRVVTERHMAALQHDLALFAEIQPDAVGVSNLGTLYLLQQMKLPLPIHADFSLNIYNSAAIDFFKNQGITRLTVSPELTLSQIGNLANRSRLELECIVHGNLPLMISEYCTIGSYLGGIHTGMCNEPCMKDKYWLKDRKGESFPIVTDQFCRMHILNAKELHMGAHIPKLGSLGVHCLRLELKDKGWKEIGEWIKLYRELIDQGTQHPLLRDGMMAKAEHDDITRGHYFRGIL